MSSITVRTRLHWRFVAVAITAVLALAASLLTPLPAQASSSEWLVPADEPLPEGAEVVGSYPLVDALVVRSDTEPPQAVDLDTEITWQSVDVDVDGPLPDDYIDPALQEIGAVDAWSANRGEGALVALIDTGVASIDALDGAVVAEIDFTGTGGGDGYGHGTFMASVIAARGDVAPGVAPEAGIVSLKVADDEGATDLGTVLGALQWLHGPGRSLGLRIATLAIGVDPDTPAGVILDDAAAHLTAAGTLVVTASGNDEEDQTLTSPATSPGTLSAGALDDGSIASFTGRGEDRLGVPQPDVLAPGVGVIGHAHPDSHIASAAAEGADEQQLARLADGHLLGSGTSVASALTAGVAALASSANPSLDGLELAAALGKDGDGQHLDALSAIAGAEAATTSRPGQDLLPNGKARPVHPHTPEVLLPLPPVAEWSAAQWNGQAWKASSWAAARWTGSEWGLAKQHVKRWNIARWNIARWNADDWSSAHWDASHWDAANWSQGDWNIARWNIARWNIARWNGDDWNIARWNIARWNIARWNAAEWTIARWNAEDWNIARWNIARWNGDDWDIARWNIARWNIARWNIARWNIARWNIARWNGDDWQSVTLSDSFE